jgi:hypothetical protein
MLEVAMGLILVPAHGPEDWKQFLAEPEKYWKRGYSARALAYCWHQTQGFPSEVRIALNTEQSLRNLEMLLAIPEHKVPLPGGARASQNDIWVLARTEDGLVSITVEGKVSESFGPTLGEWLKEASGNKQKRLAYILEHLGLQDTPPADIRYQLLHRTASAVIEAKTYFAKRAVMLVHSFSRNDEWFDDYERFLSLFDVTATHGEMVSLGRVQGIDLYSAWVRGDARFLDM